MRITWMARRRGVETLRRGGSSLRLRLECLEDRSIPATFNITTTLDVVDPADGNRSLREAITAANTLAGADVILVPAGVYNLTGGGLAITSAVTFAGAGAGSTVVDGQQLDRVFFIAGAAPSSIKVVFQGLRVRNGNAPDFGGGILVGNADLVVRDCIVTGNRTVGIGAGISNAAFPGTGNVKLVRSLVSRNVSGADGGGIFMAGDSVLTVTDSTVRRNIAAGDGGGIFAGEAAGVSAGTATLTNSTVSGNSAGNIGGGISAFTATLTRSTVSGNAAGDFGGGIAAFTATLTGSTISGNAVSNANSQGGGISAGGATLTNSTVNGNTARVGGGVSAGTATLTNSTVSGNSAAFGGGISANDATLLNCTVVENIAQTGGGLFHQFDPIIPRVFSVKNTIVALNLIKVGGSGSDINGAFASQGHNLIGDGIGGTGFANGINGDIVGTSFNPIDPKLGPLANNGGKTKTHALLAGSRAIDAGDNAGVPATDQRGAGFPRKKDGNFNGVAVVDIGAFER
jgi:hypothetical protein